MPGDKASEAPGERPGSTAPGAVAREGPAVYDPVDLLLQLRARLILIEGLIRELGEVREFYSTAEVVGRAEFTAREWCRLGRVRAGQKQGGRGKHPAWVISDDELRRIQEAGYASRIDRV